MVKSVNEILENALQNVQGKEIIIVQEGFIESKFNIKNAKCGIELDVLSIEGEKNYIRINLNQVNKVQNKENVIDLYLDNDTIIKINYKNFFQKFCQNHLLFVKTCIKCKKASKNLKK